MGKESITTLAEGGRLGVTRTGEERERFSRLYGIFLEDGKLKLRNFPSQRIMGIWMDKTGWSSPERAGQVVIVRGQPLSGLKVTKVEMIREADMEGIGAVLAPTTPRAKAAPKPEVPDGSEQDAEDTIDNTDATTADASLLGEDGELNV